MYKSNENVYNHFVFVYFLMMVINKML